MSIDSKIQQLAGHLKNDADNHILWKYVADMDDVFFFMLESDINIDDWIEPLKILGYKYYKHNFIIYDINKEVIHKKYSPTYVGYDDKWCRLVLEIVLRDIRTKKLERICTT